MPVGDYFGYIDESGAVVYVDLNAAEEPSVEGSTGGTMPRGEPGGIGSLSCAVEQLELSAAVPETSGESVILADIISSSSAAKSAEALKLPRAAPLFTIHAASTAEVAAVVAPIGAANLAKYFSSLTSPAPRINCCLCVRKSTMIVYGGVMV